MFTFIYTQNMNTFYDPNFFIYGEFPISNRILHFQISNDEINKGAINYLRVNDIGTLIYSKKNRWKMSNKHGIEFSVDVVWNVHISHMKFCFVGYNVCCVCVKYMFVEVSN